MKINREKLLKLAVTENEKEIEAASECRENRDLYKASMRIAMKIKRAIRQLDMTQAQLAQRMGMDPAALSRLLTGKANLELKTIVKFERELKINIIDRGISPYLENCGRDESVMVPKMNSLQLASVYCFTETVDMPMVNEPYEAYFTRSDMGD